MRTPTSVDFHTMSTLRRAADRTMLEAELSFYKKAAESAANDAENLLEAIKAGDTVILGSSNFSSIRVMRVPESPEAAPKPPA